MEFSTTGNSMDTTQAVRQKLTIRVGRSSLSFSTVMAGGDGNGTVVYEPYTVKSGISIAANLREAFKTAQLLAFAYQRVVVMVDSPVLMMPLEVYREEDMQLLYDHSFPSGVNRVVLPCVLSTLNAVAAFAMNKDLKLVIDDHFSYAKYMCAVAPVWRYLQQRSFTGVRSKLFGYFHDHRLDVFCFSQNRFKFCNSFDASMPNDAIYFLLCVWKHLRLNSENDELHVVGDIPDRDTVLKVLRRYIQRVYVINPVGDFNRAQVTQIKGMPYDLMTYYAKGR